MTKIYWCPVSGDPTHSGDFGDIPGLKLEIPPHASATHALLIFNMPQPYAEGTDFPGGVFRLLCDDTLLVEGCFTYSEKAPASSGRMPLTLTAKVNLSAGIQHRAEVHWAGIRGSKVHLGGSASLAAIVE
jgi:mannose-binding lectin